MGHNDHIDFELYDAIEDLVAEGEIEENSKAHGIARQVIHQGYDSLSDAQKWIYDREVIPALKRRHESLEAIRIQNSNPD